MALIILTDFPIDKMSSIELRKNAGTAISTLCPKGISAPYLSSIS